MAKRNQPARALMRAAALVMLVAGCAGSDDAGGSRQPVDVVEVVVQPGGTLLGVGIDSCNGDPSAVVTEDAESVTIEAEAFVPDGDTDDCLDGLDIDLAEPLGDRTVIDGNSDRELPVRTP